jgi:hypothetical protein
VDSGRTKAETADDVKPGPRWLTEHFDLRLLFAHLAL